MKFAVLLALAAGVLTMFASEPPQPPIASAHSAAVPITIARALTTASIPGPGSSVLIVPMRPGGLTGVQRTRPRVRSRSATSPAAFIQVCSVSRSSARSALL